MALRLVTGRSNTGKTGVIYDALRTALGRGQQALLLLPTHPDIQRATAELSHSCAIGLRIEQFDRWTGGLWALYGDGRIPVEAVQRNLLLLQSVANSGLSALSRSAGTPGFVRLVSYVAQRAADEPPDSAGRIEPRNATEAELVRLLEEYRGLLDGAGKVEPADATWSLAQDPPDCGGPVFVHRFADLSKAQEALLVAVADVQDVWVSLPWEAGFAPTEALDGLVSRLRSSASAHEHLPAATTGPAELSRLEARLFQAPEPAPGQGCVRFCTAAGAEAEAVLVAEQAADAARRFGPDRVAVVFRDASRHVESLRVTMAGAGVRADFDVLVPVARTPLGRALRRILLAAQGPGDKAALLAYLRSPYSGVAHDVVDRLDASWRGAPGQGAASALAQASRSGPAAGRALKLARAVTSGTLSSDTLEQWKELADHLFSSAHDPRDLGADVDAEIDAAAHRAVLETVARLTEIGSGRLGCSDVLDALKDARVAPETTERQGRVQVTEAHRLRSRRFDAVVVAGLTAGEFSAEGGSSAAEEVADGLFGTQRASQQARERLLFYNVVTRARERLVLVRRVADSDGSPLRPSVFWEETLDLYRHPDSDDVMGDETALVADSVRLSDLHRAAPSLSPGRSSLRAQADAGETACDPRVSESRRRAARGPAMLKDAEVLTWLAGREEFSVTELEVYSRCPYRWFFERAVRPERLDAAFDAIHRGDLAHRALAAFYSALPGRLGVRRVSPEVLEGSLALADEVFDEAAADARTPARVTLAEEDDLVRAKAQIRDLVLSDQHFLPGFEPAASELRFGEPGPGSPQTGSAGPVEIDGLKLRGSIDRVDQGEAGLVVIDYKSGSTAPKLAEFGPQRVLQVPLYAAVASRLFERPVVAGLYRSLRSGASRGFYVSGAVEPTGLVSRDALAQPALVDDLIAAAVSLARDAADGIRAGVIAPAPATSGACDFCSAARVCRRGE